MRITVLVENSIGQPGLLAEHGLAYWIETNQQNILFDTGQGPAILRNAEALGIDLSTTHTIALSHGHYDHTGGVLAVLERAPNARIVAHPNALLPKYRLRSDHTTKDTSMPLAIRNALQTRAKNAQFIDTPYSITSSIHLSGPIPMVTSFEPAPTDLFHDERAKQPDDLEDDQAMYLQTSKGIIVLLGCAHRGLINTLLHIRHLTDAQTFYAVMGGTHLSKASTERITKTTDALQQIPIKHFISGHCTGHQAQNYFQTALKDRAQSMTAGLSMSI